MKCQNFNITTNFYKYLYKLRLMGEYCSNSYSLYMYMKIIKIYKNVIH